MLTETLYIAELFPVMFLLNSSPEINLVVFPFLQNACARDQFRFFFKWSIPILKKQKKTMNPWGHYQRFPNKRLQTWTSLRQWSLRTERNLAPGRYVQRRSSDEIVLRQFQTISCIINILGSVDRHHEWRVRSCWISLVDSTEVCISPSETFYSLSLSLSLLTNSSQPPKTHHLSNTKRKTPSRRNNRRRD